MADHPLDHWYLKQEEPVQGCLLALRAWILDFHPDIAEAMKTAWADDATRPAERDYRIWKSLIEYRSILERAQLGLIGQVLAFFSSGIFFILLGGFLLYAAVFLIHGENHTSFTFIFVVLGVAILLYGTHPKG